MGHSATRYRIEAVVQRASPTVALWVALLVGATLIGCEGVRWSAPRGPTAPPTLVPTLQPTVVAATPGPTHDWPDPAKPLTLTLWLPPEMAIADGRSGREMQRIVKAFADQNPGIRLSLVPKAAHGSAGLTSALLATRPVVPARMPDLVAVDLAELPRLAYSGIATRLDALLPPSTWEDVYPFAGQATQVDGARMAVPFHADVTFLAYNRSVVTLPPRTWDELVVGRATLVVPLPRGEDPIADSFWTQYLGYGGQVGANGSKPILDVSTLARVLANYRRAVDAGVLPAKLRSARSFDDCWKFFLAGAADLACVGSWQFPRDESTLPGAGYARLPTPMGDPLTLASTWGWVIVTTDPLRQQAAARLILHARNTAQQVAWSIASDHLPVYRGALAGSVSSARYRAFLADQLESAIPFPTLGNAPRVQETITRAIEDVLESVITPEGAAATIVTALARMPTLD